MRRTNRQGLVQGVRLLVDGESTLLTTYLIFEEAKIPDATAETAFKITPTLGGSSNIILKFSNDDVPSDILNPDQFKKAFRLPDLPFPDPGPMLLPLSSCATSLGLQPGDGPN